MVFADERLKLRDGSADVLATDKFGVIVGAAESFGAKLKLDVVVDDDAGTPEDIGRDGVLNENPPLVLTLFVLVVVDDEAVLRLGMTNVTFFGVLISSEDVDVTGVLADVIPVRPLEARSNPPVGKDFGLSSVELVGVILKVGIDFGNWFLAPSMFPTIAI